MSEVEGFLLENEKIVFESKYGFIPALFGEETFYITSIRSIKCVSPGLFSRKTFMFLPHIVARGQALAPIMDWVAAIFWGLLSFLALFLIFTVLGAAELGGFIAFILSVVIALLMGRKQVFAVFGEPTINIVISDETIAESGLKIVTKLQDEIISRNQR